MLILALTYKSDKEKLFVEERFEDAEEERLSCAAIVVEIVQDYKFWRFMLFCFVIVGSKLVFSLFFFMLPKMITQNNGEDAPFGVYVSVAPILILVFLFILSPLQANRDPYELIMIGSIIATASPVPMLFGMGVINFVVFITLISFAEALYSPIINVFTFNFTKAGREGTFLTLTAAPTYFTMALTGIIGGFLLEHYYPVKEDANVKRQPFKIWMVIMTISCTSVVALYLGWNYFNVKGSQAESEVPELLLPEDQSPLVVKAAG